MALLDLPALPGLRSIDLGDSDVFMGLDRQVGRMRGGVIDDSGGQLNFTDYRAVAGASGMGLVSESGSVAGMYLGTLRGQGIFTPASAIEAFRRSDVPMVGLGDLDYPTLRRDLSRRGLHYRVASAFQDRREAAVRGLGLGLHSGQSAFELTPSQSEAMQHQYGPAVVLAGPGSGKSRVLMERLDYLTDEGIAREEDILTLVFGKNVQEELTERGRKAGRNYNISTIDAFARGVVRSNYEYLGYKSAPDITMRTFRDWLPDAHERLKEIGVDFNPKDEKFLDTWSDLFESERTTFMEGREDYSHLDPTLQRAIGQFRKEKYAAGKIDFTDAILQSSYLLEQQEHLRTGLRERFPFVQIDEFHRL